MFAAGNSALGNCALNGPGGMDMAIKNIVVSDISGQEVGEEEAATIVVSDHPAISGAVELDVTKGEAQALQSSKIDLVSLLVYDGSKEPRRVIMAGKDFNALFKNTDVDAALKAARPSQERQAKRGRRSSGGSKAEKIDYTAMENIGLRHRGRVTEEEARLVRENMAQANKNREREGQPKIGEDPKDADRYSL